MLAALWLAERGVNVSLVSQTTRLGGHFAGLTLDGRLFDAGMTFLEFTSFNNDMDAAVASYDSARRNDAGRFAGLVKRWLSPFGFLAPCPNARHDRRWHDHARPDYCQSGFIVATASIGSPAANEGRARAVGVQSWPLTCVGETRTPTFADYDFETVSLANHGRTFHNVFVEPFCAKVTGLSTAQMSAVLHRLAWAPLFYPETLLHELEGESPSLPKRRSRTRRRERWRASSIRLKRPSAALCHGPSLTREFPGSMMEANED
jgi:hypothetical protein